jgi:hypothetical protein
MARLGTGGARRKDGISTAIEPMAIEQPSGLLPAGRFSFMRIADSGYTACTLRNALRWRFEY